MDGLDIIDYTGKGYEPAEKTPDLFHGMAPVGKEAPTESSFSEEMGRVLLELAERLANLQTEADIYYVFSVQEEVGCRGSKPATYAIAPDIALCFDVTATGDIPCAAPMACAVGKGVAIKIKDNSVICHSGLVGELCDIAKSERIPYQREVLTFGGTDTSSMQLTGCGAVAGALSIPTRYVHSGVELCDMKDVAACVDLAEKYILTVR